MIELAGSVYDPTNPPIPPSSGQMHRVTRSKLLREVCTRESINIVTNPVHPQVEDADLVLILCPTYEGLPSEKLLSTVSQRSATGLQYLQGGALGIVLIGTGINPSKAMPWSEVATLRINQNVIQTIDLVLKDLHLDIIESRSLRKSTDLRILVEYERCGCRAVAGKEMMWLDLRPGQKIRIGEDHEHDQDGGTVRQKQVKVGRDSERGVQRLCQNGSRQRIGLVSKYREDLMALVVVVEKVEHLLGIWWLESISEGKVEYTPVVNSSPKMSSRVGCRICE